MALLLALLACTEDSTDVPRCARPDSPTWSPETADLVRAELDDLNWTERTGSAVDDDATVAGVDLAGTMDARLVVERGTAHTVVARWSGASPATVQIRSGTPAGQLLGDLSLAPGAEATATFTPAGGARTVAFVVSGTGTLERFTVSAPGWTNPSPDQPATALVPAGATLHLGVLVHLEAEPRLGNDEAAFRRRAAVLEGLSATLAAHAGALTLQPDASLARGIENFEPDWLDDRRSEGAALSVHAHADEPTSRALLIDVREARQRWSALGLDVRDLNGGFQVAPWKELARAGIRSLTAWKDRDDQAGLSGLTLEPWRPASEVTDAAGFARHDPDAPLVYLPGSPTSESDPLRFDTSLPAVLRQGLLHAQPGHVNTWYVVLHVDQFGLPFLDDDAAMDAWLAAGGLADELAPLDRFLTAEVDPLVEAGVVIWATPDTMREAYEAWEQACADGT